MQVRVFGSWLLLADEDVVRPNPGYRVRVRVRVRVGIPRPSDPDPNPIPNLYYLAIKRQAKRQAKRQRRAPRPPPQQILIQQNGGMAEVGARLVSWQVGLGPPVSPNLP